MRLQFGLVAFCAAVSVAGQGLACSRVVYPAAWAAGEVDVAGHLVRAATTVEVVVAERARVLGGAYPGLLDEAWKSMDVLNGGSEAAEITFRVVERLKGSGPEIFALRGAVLTPPPGGEMTPPRFFPEYEIFRTLDQPNDCRMVVPAVIGGRCLVFRDGDGGLLEATAPVGGRGGGELVGPAYEPVGDDDPWLERVRRAAAQAITR